MACWLDQLLTDKVGKIGEDVPPSEFTHIIDLNRIKHNFPVFDIMATKEDEIYVFSIKARKKYGKGGKLNPCYNVLSGKTISRKYKKALDLFTTMGHDIETIHYCFMIIPLEEDQSCIYYWG